MPKLVHRIVVDLTENDYGDQDIKVDPGTARAHEVLGILGRAAHIVNTDADNA